MNQQRQPPGQPTGGQFVGHERRESPIELGAGDSGFAAEGEDDLWRDTWQDIERGDGAFDAGSEWIASRVQDLAPTSAEGQRRILALLSELDRTGKR